QVTHLFITPAALATLDPAGLDSLRVLAVGGEAYSPELLAKWAIPLGDESLPDRPVRQFHNIYGPTETTIVVNIGEPLLPGDALTMGGPNRGMRSLVLDSRLQPVPDGVAGELYIAGPQVTRGYHARAGLTADRFVANPFGDMTGGTGTAGTAIGAGTAGAGGAAGERMYRTGDVVRWTSRPRPGGRTEYRLEYVGRSDFQVKVRGFRIELGEIDTALTAHETVDFAATIGHTNAAGAVVLVSYVVAAPGRSIDTAVVKAHLEERVPTYMVPSSIMVLDSIPLTPVGKLDRRALPEPVFETDTEFRAPRNPLEQTIAEVFGEVLGVARVGVDDSFFALGGDSIVSIQLVSRAKARGVIFTPRDVFEQRTVAGLAAVAETGGAPGDAKPVLAELPGGGVGTMPLTPVVKFMVERPGSFGRFNQTLALELPAGIDREGIAATAAAVIDRHDMLRARLRRHGGAEWIVETAASGTVDVDALIERVEFDADADDEALFEIASAALDSALDRLDPEAGVVIRFVWLEPIGASERTGRLIVVAHHLVIDGVSWRILVPDFVAAWGQLSAGQTPELAPTGTSMRTWAHALERLATERGDEIDRWRTVVDGPDPLLTERPLDPTVDVSGVLERHRLEVSAEATRALLTTVPELFHGGVNDGLVTALVLALAKWRTTRAAQAPVDDSVLVRLEGHGREEDVVPGADLSRTVGWFTAIFPVRFELSGIDIDAALTGGPALGPAIKAIKEQLLAVPDKGLGYGLLRYLNPETAARLPEQLPGQVSFNYLGRVSEGQVPEALRGFGWIPAPELGALGGGYDADMPVMAPLDINAIVVGDQLSANIGYPTTLLDAEAVAEFGRLWVAALEAVARHADSAAAGGHTPSDFVLVRVTQHDIDGWEQRFPSLSEVWPLSALQAGLQFHAQLAAASVDVYTAQAVLTLTGRLDSARLRSAAQALVDRYENLRTAFVTDGAGNPVQLVLDDVRVAWAEFDRRATGDASDLIEADRMHRFDLAEPPLIRFTLIRVAADSWRLAVSNHHILLDGWSMPLLMRDLLVLYATRSDTAALPPVRSYRHFLEWVAQQDHSASVRAWTTALRGVSEPTLLTRPDAGREITALSGEYVFELDEDATARLTGLASELGVTANTVLQAAWGILLGRWTGRDDVLFGTTVSGRPPQLSGVESMVGLFINTVPVRVRFAESESARELLVRIQGEQADLLDHHYVGLAEIQAAAGVGGLFDTLVVFESYPVDAEGIQRQAADIDGMAVTGLDATDATHYPLTLIVQLDSRLRIRAGYLRDLFDEDTVRRIADRLVRVLTAITVEPDAAVGGIELLEPAERELIVSGWNATEFDVEAALSERAVPAATLVAMFEAQAARTPDAPAVTFEGTSLSYAEFAARVHKLARWLIERGVGPETLVGLGMRRSIDLVVGMYAVSAAGGAYVPLDPEHPAERTQYILATADPVCVLTSGADLDTDTAQVRIDLLELSAYSTEPVSDAERRAPLRPGNTAYVIFTSGSTGRPKGVAVTHAAIANRLVWMQSQYGLTADDVVLQKTPATFDVSVWEFFWPLQIGARLVVAKPDGHRDPAYLSELIAAEGVTVTHFVPSMLTVFVTEPAVAQCGSLRMVFASGEALAPKSAHRLRELTGAELHNLYGPTEAAVDVTYHRVVDADVDAVPIGRPVFNTRVYVLDARLRPVPEGVAGELYLAGDQLARGYVARTDLTADRFVANPFGAGNNGTTGAGERMYRTGDLVMWTADGELQYLGRTDFQVKLRGQRLELGEIEAALTALDEVAQAVVVVRGDQHTGDQLVAYVVAAPGLSIDVETLREDLGQRLPSYMVPSVVMDLEELPLNASGKLDRRALPAPVFEAATFRAPTTPVEEIVAGTFAEVLGLERVGLDDDFFALGGNSLIATQVAARLSSALNTQLGVREIFEVSTVAALAARAESGAGAGGRNPLVPQERPERIPLSLAQQRMWFLNRFDPESAVDNIPVVVRLSGLLDRQALHIAVADVLARHESLRTRYPEVNGAAYQEIVPTGRVIPDLTPIEVTESELPLRLSELVLTGFDVTAEPPFRAGLFEISPTEHVLVVVVHHISGDGFSMGPFARDVMTAYGARVDGGEPAWRPLDVQYADFAIWQRQVLGSEDDPNSVIAQQISYWTEALAGAPEQLDLPSDRPRPAVASGRGGIHNFEISAETQAKLAELARARGATMFMVVHAALAVLLSRLSSESDISIGTPVAGRGDKALDDMIGMFVNTLVLRTEIDGGTTFGELLQSVRAGDIAAFGHADLPFERLVEILNPRRSQARNPLFQVMLSLQNNRPTTLELPGLTVSGVELPTETAKFDLALELTEQLRAAEATGNGASVPAGITAKFVYATDLFDDETVAGFARRFVRILKAVAATPDRPVGDIPLLDAREAALQLRGWNDTAVEIGSPAPLVEQFAAQVRTTPDAIAVVDRSTEEGPATALTYAELASRVHRLARRLIEAGVGPDVRVALGMRRSLDLVIAIHAVLEAGGAYVPLDLDQPADRIAYVLETAAPACVLTTARDAFAPADLPVLATDDPDLSGYSDAPVTDAERVAPLRPQHLAYVIFTSGSTGRPKGVGVSHAALQHQMRWLVTEFGIGAEDVVLYKTPATFDASVWEPLAPLLTGARVVVATPDGHRDTRYLAEVIAAERITLASFVPSLLTVFATTVDPAALGSLRALLVGGEAFTGEAVKAFRRLGLSGVELVNLYGPTEFTVNATYSVAPETVDAALPALPIGAPVWNTQAYVLDSRLHPVPPGVVGELYLAGAQLARGYVDRAGLTAERFVANPFGDNGSRLYRTGDLVARDASGALVYRGRSDFQVKLRGLRIEPGEIEYALRAHDAVAQAVALVRSGDRTGDRLVAYVVPAESVSGDTDFDATLRAHLATMLPSYMIPSAIVVLDALPLTANGKLDRRALPEPAFEVREFRAPSTPIEEIVANTFADVLGLDTGARAVGVDDDFFELGGNSLIATQVVARLGSALNTRVPVRLLFEASTVSALAVRVEGQVGSGRRELVAGPRPARIPLSLAQQRMWFLNRFDQQSAAYNVPMVVRLTGALDIEALRAAVEDLVARHEVLRTVYPETDGRPVQVILPVAQALPELEVRPVAPDAVEAAVLELTSTIFDVTTEVPLRVALFDLTDRAAAPEGTGDYVVAMVIHHISGDGSSAGPLTRDLMTAYAARAAGEAPGWAPLAVHYADYSIWQREVLGSEDDPESLAAKQIGYWKTALADLPEQLDLPADRPRPAVQTFAGSKVPVEIDAEIHRALGELARAEGATLFMVVHTAFAVLLSRLSGTEDIAIGTPMSGRGEAVLDDLIGMFVNTLVFRTQVDAGASFTDLLARQREIDIQAFANADMPFERLVEVLNPVRSTGRHPLFQVGLSFQNLAQTSLELPGLRVSGLDLDTGLSQFDLHLIIADNYGEAGEPAGLSGFLTYATDLFDRATVEQFVERFVRLLGEIVATPRTAVGDLELLGGAERDRMLLDWNDTRHEVDPELLLDGYRRAVAAHPDRVAVVYEGAELTYREFDERVNRLARHLISQGVGPESLVGLAVRRSLDLVVGMYAIVTAGGAYVPLDPDHPAERIGYVLDTARPVCVLTAARDGFEVPGEVPVVEIDTVDLSGFDGGAVRAEELRGPVHPDNPAYVIFTSGSTGRPKGVAVSHGAIHNQITWMLTEYPMGTDDVYLQKTATTFDVSLWGYFMPLRAGATLVVATPDGHRDPAYLAETIAAQRVTVTDFVPSMLTVFAAHTPAGSVPTLRDVFAIGEALPPETVAAMRAVTSATVHNLYGPTEAAVSITYRPATGDERGSVPIGVPQWNSQVYVLDSRLRPVPAGVAGELYLAGDQLARGYVTRPDLTADRFVANPFGDMNGGGAAGEGMNGGGAAGQRMYRTGDLVVWRDGGVLEYIGRTDFQVKFRGQRIELGDIESALLAQPSVSQAVALVVPSDLGDQLVAYVVPAPGASIDQTRLLTAAGQTLPAYMIPAAIVALDAFPLNTSGKLDRKALPQPTFARREFRAPSTPIEEIVAGVFADVLGVARVGADDDFFALGGNSLIATQVIARLGAAVGARVPMRTLFETPTVAALAAAVESQARGVRTAELGSVERPERIPLSLAQQRMWFLNRFDQESAAYNVPIAVRLTGALDVEALRSAIGDLVARHEVLRTVYPEVDGAPVQVILPPGQAVPELEVRAVAPEAIEAAVIGFFSTGFDVTTEVPLRVVLFEIDSAAREYVLAMVIHHIAGDGSSAAPLTRDLVTAYAARAAGEAPGWAPLAVQYADYSVWQRAVLGSEDDPESLAAKQIGYWKTALADLPEQLDLPSDRPRPATQSFAGGKVDVHIDAEMHRALVELARAEGATLFMVVHTAFAVLLSRLSGTEDIAIGTPMAGRGEAALDDLIGMFMNTLVFRTRADAGAAFTELLARQRETDIQAFANADVPFERLVEVLNPARSTARHPLFQMGLSFQNIALPTLELPGLTVGAMDIDTEQSQFDLHLIVSDRYDESGVPAGIGGFLTYASDLFDESTVRGFVDRLVRLFGEIIAAPRTPIGDLELLDGGERDRILVEWNDTRHDVAPELLLDGYRRAVAEHPDRVAVSYEGAELTYREFDERVNILARRLIYQGVGPESLVGLAVRRSLDLVVGMYAIVTAGGAYVPLDPDHPAERIAHVLETAQPICVLSTTADAVPVPGDIPVLHIDTVDLDGFDGTPVQPDELLEPLHPDNPAYVIFTSGSTGRPKGVAVSHAAIHNQTTWMLAEYPMGADDVYFQKTATTFDVSLWGYFMPLRAGAKLVVATHDGHRDPAYLAETIAAQRVTVTDF
ncbi:non-ribosomal peptide synthetase, partial [Nocardia wallacei]|uniref:non-ribosomal peptide synthetase n=1 Tax=Nocardia wallacei TaxID=480035 RepID=UPI002456DFED